MDDKEYLNFPCSKECLKYPICKNAVEIYCEDLRIFYEFTGLIRGSKAILDTFPNVSLIHATGTAFYKIRDMFEMLHKDEDPECSKIFHKEKE